MPCALGTNKLGNPSANVLLHSITETHHQKMAARNSQVEHETSPFDLTVELSVKKKFQETSLSTAINTECKANF